MLTTGQPLTANQQSALIELQPYLARIAGKMHHTYYPTVPADDLLQEMNAAICEQAARDPAFLDQAPGYVTRKAAWAARDYARHATYLDLDGGESLERMAAPAPDLDLGIDVRRALGTLDRKRQEIAAMLAGGWKRKEIAARFGVKSPSLSWDLGKIRAALGGVGS